jgi:hypothetical protein
MIFRPTSGALEFLRRQIDQHPESLNDAGADALRCSRHNGYPLLCAHDPALSMEDATV